MNFLTTEKTIVRQVACQICQNYYGYSDVGWIYLSKAQETAEEELLKFVPKSVIQEMDDIQKEILLKAFKERVPVTPIGELAEGDRLIPTRFDLEFAGSVPGVRTIALCRRCVYKILTSARDYHGIFQWARESATWS